MNNYNEDLIRKLLDGLKNYTCKDMEEWYKGQEEFKKIISKKDLEFLCLNIKCYVSMNKRNIVSVIKNAYGDKLFRDEKLRVDYLNRIVRKRSFRFNEMYSEFEEDYNEDKYRLWVARRYHIIQKMIEMQKIMKEHLRLNETTSEHSTQSAIVTPHKPFSFNDVLTNSEDSYLTESTEPSALANSLLPISGKCSERNLEAEENPVLTQKMLIHADSDQTILSSQSIGGNFFTENREVDNHSNVLYTESVPEYLTTFGLDKAIPTSTQQTNMV